MWKYRFILFFLFIPFLQACLNDNLDFPEEETDNDNPPASTVALTTLFHTIQNHPDWSSNACFDFVYPISLHYNIEIEINIQDQLGLIEAAKNLTSDFYPTALVFPFLIKKEDQLIRVENEMEFNDLLTKCGIQTLANSLYSLLGQCFNFNYPINVFELDSASLTIRSSDELDHYLTEGDFINSFGVEFPVTLTRYKTNEEVTLNNYVELHAFLDGCQSCPDVYFTIDEEFDGSYIFRAEFAGRDSVDYSWYIDDTFVMEGGSATLHQYHEFFNAGTYKICLKATTDDCKEGVSYCYTLEVAPFCPPLFYEYELFDETNLGIFEAEFPGRVRISYTWVVIQNEIIQHTAIVPEGGDHLFDYVFEPGTYQVCIETETDDCPEVRRYCQEIVVTDCPELSFETQQDGASNVYYFFANFIMKDEIGYSWRIFTNDQLIYQEEELIGGDNQMIYEFEPGSYDVCLRAETADCPEVIFCQNVIIE